MICNRLLSRDQVLLITIGKSLWMQRVWRHLYGAVSLMQPIRRVVNSAYP
jgi:hypothetical protein